MATGDTHQLGDGETLRWLMRIDAAVEGLRDDLATDRRTAEARYVTAERHVLELDLVRAEVHTVRDELEELQDRTKYAFRTAVGAVLAVVTALVVSIIRLKVGGP